MVINGISWDGLGLHLLGSTGECVLCGGTVICRLGVGRVVVHASVYRL